MAASLFALNRAQLVAELHKYEAMADRAESDGEYEAIRQVIIAIKNRLERFNQWAA